MIEIISGDEFKAYDAAAVVVDFLDVFDPDIAVASNGIDFVVADIVQIFDGFADYNVAVFDDGFHGAAFDLKGHQAGAAYTRDRKVGIVLCTFGAKCAACESTNGGKEDISFPGAVEFFTGQYIAGDFEAKGIADTMQQPCFVNVVRAAEGLCLAIVDNPFTVGI